MRSFRLIQPSYSVPDIFIIILTNSLTSSLMEEQSDAAVSSDYARRIESIKFIVHGFW